MFYQKLNSVWHKRALNLFMFVVLAHWAEHLAQAYQIYLLGWPRPKAGGFLGLLYPWLVNVNNVEKTIAADPNRPKTRNGLRLTAAIDSSPTTVETAVVATGRAALLNAARIVSSTVECSPRSASLK